MLPTKMIPLESVLKDVYMMIRDSDVQDDFVMECAIKAMEYLMVYKTYDHKVCILRVENNQTLFPHGMLGIEVVLYNKDPQSSFKPNLLFTDTYNVVSSIHSEFISESYTFKLSDFRQVHTFVNKGWQYLKLSDYAFNKSILCNPAAFLGITCGDWFHPDTVKQKFITSFESGYLAVAYYSYPQDEEGKYLIIDNTYIRDAIESYVYSRVYQKMWHNSVQGAQQKFQFYTQQWKEQASAAIGEMMKMSQLEYINAANSNTMFKRGIKEKIFGGFGHERFNNNY